MQLISLKSIGKYTALVSFVLGLLFFIIFYFFRSQTTFYLIIWYSLIATCINFMVIVSLLFPKDRIENFRTIGFMLFNVPIAFIFFVWLVIIFFNTQVIDFVNRSDSEISEIKIYGCDKKYIANMKPGESRTLWFRVFEDCSITTNYLKNGESFQETVLTHTSPGTQGGWATYYIGEDNPLSFQH